MSLFLLQNSNSVHSETVNQVVKDLRSFDSCNVTFVSSDGKDISVSRVYIYIFCKHISSVLRSCNFDQTTFSIPLNSAVIQNVFELVSNGFVYIDSDSDIADIREAVEVLGIDLDTSKLTHSQKQVEFKEKEVKVDRKRRNGVNKDTLRKIKEENKERLKNILFDMNEAKQESSDDQINLHQNKVVMQSKSNK